MGENLFCQLRRLYFFSNLIDIFITNTGGASAVSVRGAMTDEMSVLDIGMMVDPLRSPESTTTSETVRLNPTGGIAVAFILS
jgi:hypothetical protein